MISKKSWNFQYVNKQGLVDLSNVMDQYFLEFYKSAGRLFSFDDVTNETLKDSLHYRYLFYIETVILKLEEEDIHCLDEVVTWINRFQTYEDILNEKQNVSKLKGDFYATRFHFRHPR